MGTEPESATKPKVKNDWLTYEEAKQISDVLIGVWTDAEWADDEDTVRRVKATLDFLELPWVRL